MQLYLASKLIIKKRPMNKNIFTALAVLFSITVLIWSGCKKDDGPNTERFIIQIDSIVHPDTINFGADLSIKFYGPIGPDGCYAFDKLVPDLIEGELVIVSWGIHTFEDICTQSAVYMNGHELLVSEVPAGEFIIKAVQPNGSAIIGNVFVKE